MWSPFVGRRLSVVVRLSVVAVLLEVPLGTPVSAAVLERSASAPVHVALEKGSIEFVATGWPSALVIRGKGTQLTGDVVAEPDALSGELKFELDCLDTGIALRNRHMREEYLETGRHPYAIFRPTSLLAHKLPASASFAAQPTSFEGEMELHGVTRPVHGTARIRRDGETVGVEAHFDLRTTDFGIRTPSYMGITVAEQVQVTVRFEGHVSDPGEARGGEHEK
jgi:polyisoprenoid-binding protein YceI